MSTRARLSTVAIGAGSAVAAFFLDPQSGRRRRKETVERSAAMARRGARGAKRAAFGMTAQAEAMQRRLLHAVSGRARPVASEEMLADRVRSELFRDAKIPKGALNINVERDDVVVLRGQVQRAAQIRDVERRVRRIAGVRDVENLLHTPDTPAPMHT